MRFAEPLYGIVFQQFQTANRRNFLAVALGR
jgi:hypothetical protein